MPTLAYEVVIFGFVQNRYLIILEKPSPGKDLFQKSHKAREQWTFLCSNTIFTGVLFHAGCQFSLLHLQQWGRGEISPDGGHPDWQPVSPGKPSSLITKLPMTSQLGPAPFKLSHPFFFFLPCFFLNGKCYLSILGCLDFYLPKKIFNYFMYSESLWQLSPLQSYWLCSLCFGLWLKCSISVCFGSINKL